MVLDETRWVPLLTEFVQSVCPGAGLRIGNYADRGTWVVVPPKNATQQQIEAANATIAAFDATTAVKAKSKHSAIAWILSSDDPNAVAVRCLFRALLKMPPANRKWSDLAAAARQEIANETDPNA